jgi:hypothetical protein
MSREREKLRHMEFWMTCHCNGRNCQDLYMCANQKYCVQAIGIDCLACTEPKQCSITNKSFRFISCWRQNRGSQGSREGIPGAWMHLIFSVWSL